MGFNSVYRVLQDVFPQVDSRILRAVAIEHSKDADVAVEVVIEEILPHLSEQKSAVNSSNNSMSSLGLFPDSARSDQLESTVDPVVTKPYLHEQSSEARFTSVESLLGATEEGGTSGQVESAVDPLVTKPCLHEKSTEACFTSVDGSLLGATEALDAVSSQLSHTVAEPVNVEPLTTSFYHDANGETEAECGENTSINLGDVPPVCEKGFPDYHDLGFVGISGESVSSIDEFLLSNAGASESIQEEDTLHLDINEITANLEHMHTDIDNKTSIPASNLLVGICETTLAVTQESDTSCSSKTIFEKDSFVIDSNSGDETTMPSVLTRSETNCSTEFLEEIIEDAKNNKKTFMLAMNSVVDLMKEVECKEKAAEEVKESVSHSCSDILAKVDEVKQALLRAKEANDMHAGEVNAEKAILATEMKELQLRLFTLSDERNKSLGILDEMRRGLEIRLATALKEIAEAEEEKLEKQRLAREALSYQESQMEKVVEESKRLKLEAEENSKLQEFLMDRGRAIDILQGEISVKCQDVLLLKEKFDKRIPLSRSLSSSQTSSILASSGSSLKTNCTSLEAEGETYESSKKSAEELGDSYGFLDKVSRSEVTLQSPKFPIETHSKDDHIQSGEEKKIDDRKALLGDGWESWEIFDSAEFMIR